MEKKGEYGSMIELTLDDETGAIMSIYYEHSMETSVFPEELVALYSTFLEPLNLLETSTTQEKNTQESGIVDSSSGSGYENCSFLWKSDKYGNLVMDFAVTTFGFYMYYY